MHNGKDAVTKRAVRVKANSANSSTNLGQPESIGQNIVV
ncbi:MAG: hypothetical protein ACI9VT_003782 [Psychroserpens sp.]|jgi:hypothetical protein